jgi:peroxiredoxin
MIGIFGLLLVVAISIYQFARHGVGTTGVPPGHRLHFFAAPLAASTLNGDPNLDPPCTLARHDPRALNICLLSRRAPLVLAFFVTGSTDCRRQVDALQALSGEFPVGAVQFAAVAVNASHSDTAALVRSHHWTIPVAYDRDGAVGALYGVEVCPMVELAYRGGIVKDRLIGDHWVTGTALAPRVRALLHADPTAARRGPGGVRTT